MPAVFLPVTWSENCVLFPNGTRRPFDELVRSSLTCGQIKARRHLLHDGAAEHALKHGAPRGTRWSRYRMDLDPYSCRLAWFEDKRGRGTRNPRHCDSVHLACTPCAVYVNRLDPTQLALAFGSQLLLLKAEREEEAADWTAVLASAIFFSSDSFKALVDECSRCFAIAISLRSGQDESAELSLPETAALLRVMLRPLDFKEMSLLESRLAPAGKGLGVEAFTALFRHVSKDLAFPRYCFNSKLLCGSPSSLHPPPHLHCPHTIAILFAQYTTSLRPLFWVQYTIQY